MDSSSKIFRSYKALLWPTFTVASAAYLRAVVVQGGNNAPNLTELAPT